MRETIASHNKALVLAAFDTLADMLHIENGMLVEHWDVIQDEATRETSKSGLPMFGDTFRA